MVPLLADQDLVEVIVAGLQRKHPQVDLIRVREVDLAEADDDAVLAWAAENGRVVISHDRSTMSDAAHRRVRDGLPMLGLVTFTAVDLVSNGDRGSGAHRFVQ